MKKFQKLGVFRSDFHNIDSLPDCEFVSIHDMVDAARAATEIGKTSNVDRFFEQLSTRLMRDADLVPINDLAAILQEYHRNDYLDLGLVNKIKNELVFDMDKVQGPELAVALHTILGCWNIVSPKLIRKGLERAVRISNSLESVSVSLILKSLKNCPNRILLSAASQIQTLVTAMSARQDSTYSELTSTCKVLVWLSQQAKLNLALEPLIEQVLSRDVSDVESAADALWVAASTMKTVNQKSLEKIVNNLITNSSSVTETCKSIVDSLETIERRNKAVRIASSVVLSCEKLGELNEVKHAYLAGITRESVRGVRPLDLGRLAKVKDIQPEVMEGIQKELRRKNISHKLRL
jgi:hypothetical protein